MERICISQNQAYDLLTTKYLPNPSDGELQMISDLFKDWLRSKNEGLLVHMFQIIDSHESQEVRNLALDHIQRFLPSQKRELVLNLWITHPLPSLKDFIKQLVDTYRDKIKKPLLSALFVMLDELIKLEEMDPDLIYLDTYLEDMDPSLGSLLFERAGKLKKKLFATRPPQIFSDENVSIADLLSKKDYDTLWQSVLNYPFPFICEMIKTLEEEGWTPDDLEIRRFKDILAEYLGNEGWKPIEHVLDLTLSIRDPKTQSFRKLTQTETRMKLIDIKISPIIFTRPDRIPKMPFVNRGRFNLVDNALGISIYQERVRYSSFTGKLHIPIYSSNGVQIAEIVAFASQTSSFHMDEDGLYFSIKTKGGTYSVDLDALASFLLPFNQHTELIAAAIPVMLSDATGRKRLIIEAMKLLSDLQQGRSFSIFDLKEEVPIVNHTKNSCCSLAFDFGNYFTKVGVIPSTCNHRPVFFEFPSAIYYLTPSQKFVGDILYQKEIEGEPVDPTLIFTDIQYGLAHGTTHTIRVQNLTIDVQTATSNFIEEVIKIVMQEIDYPISTVVFSHQSNVPLKYLVWMKQQFHNLGFETVTGLNSALSHILADYRLKKTKGVYLYVNVNENGTELTLVELPPQKTKKRKETELLKVNQPAPKIVVQRYVPYGLPQLLEKLKKFVPDNVPDLDKNRMVVNGVQELFTQFESHIFPNPIFIDSNNDCEYCIDTSLFFDFEKLSFVLRDIFYHGLDQGIPKSKISGIIFSGLGKMYPDLARFIFNYFDKQFPIVVLDDPDICAKGLGIFGNGQQIEAPLGYEIMLRTSDEGLMTFQTLFQEGEKITGMSKKFQINMETKLDTIALDVWTKRSNYEKAIEKEEHEHSNIEDQYIFDKLTPFPRLLPISKWKNPIIFAGIDKFGRFGLSIHEKDTDEIVLDYISPML